MGEAWLEAAETEIRARQSLAGKRSGWLAAFVMETIFVVLPQSYRTHFQLQTASPHSAVQSLEEYIPPARNTLRNMLSFAIDSWMFLILGFALSVAYFAIKIKYSLDLHEFMISNTVLDWAAAPIAIVVALFAIVRFKQIKTWWKSSGRPIVGPIVHTLLGLYIGALLALMVANTATAKTVENTFSQYLNVRDQMGWRNNGGEETNQWFTQGLLNTEMKSQWCTLSEARLETFQTTLIPNQDNALKGKLIGMLWGRVYANGCWDNENEYLKIRHLLSSKASAKDSTLKLFSAVEDLPPFNSLLELQNRVSYSTLYSPRLYCEEYMTKRYNDIGIPYEHLDMSETSHVCAEFPKYTSVVSSQAQLVRDHVNDYFKGKQ